MTFNELQAFYKAAGKIINFSPTLTFKTWDQTSTIPVNNFEYLHMLQDAMKEYKAKIEGQNPSQETINEVGKSLVDALKDDDCQIYDLVENATPLYRAVQLNDMEQVDTLMKARVNINLGIIDNTREKKAFDASMEQVGLRRDPNSSLEPNHPKTPLEEAIKLGHTEIAVKLLNAAGAHLTSRYNANSLIQTASKMGNAVVLKMLIEKLIATAQAYTRSNNSNQNNFNLGPVLDKDEALHLAVMNGHTEVAKILIQHGANINMKDQDGMTPLLHAAKGANVEIVQLLLEKGAKPDIKDEGGNTALHYAAMGLGREVRQAPMLGKSKSLFGAVTRSLTLDTTPRPQEGISEQELNDQGNSRAQKHQNYTEIAKALVTNNADRTLENSQGQTAEHVASEHDNQDVLQVIRAGGKPSSSMW